MNDFSDLRCERCGSTQIGHFEGRDSAGRRGPRNRCQSCGLESEYIPTLADIRRECRLLRAEQGLPWEEDERAA